MYRFKLGTYVTEIIEASSEAIARIKLAEMWECELRDLPRNIEVFKIG